MARRAGRQLVEEPAAPSRDHIGHTVPREPLVEMVVSVENQHHVLIEELQPLTDDLR
jgi:hypothetical protein